MSVESINYRKCEGCKFESEEELTKSCYECGLMGSEEKKELEIICSYIDKDFKENKERKFDSFAFFGKWVADNITQIEIVDVIQQE